MMKILKLLDEWNFVINVLFEQLDEPIAGTIVVALCGTAFMLGGIIGLIITLSLIILSRLLYFRKPKR